MFRLQKIKNQETDTQAVYIGKFKSLAMKYRVVLSRTERRIVQSLLRTKMALYSEYMKSPSSSWLQKTHMQYTQ